MIDALLQTAARALTGSTYAVLGFDAVRTPGARVAQAAPLLDLLRTGLHLPLPGDELVVRGNAALQTVAGALLAVGVLPRASAVGLAASLVPTTIAGHAFWAVGDPLARKAQRIQFHKNTAMLGGLLLAVSGGGARDGSQHRGVRAR